LILRLLPLGAKSTFISFKSGIALNQMFSYLYTLAARQTEINVMKLDGPGQAQTVQKLDITGPASLAGVPIGRNNLASIHHYMADAI